MAVGHVLVIAPKKVAEATWQKEAAKWEHLKKLRISTALGTEKQRTAAIGARADITITNRENTQWIVEAWGNKWPYDMIVIDESTSFKNPSAKRFKALKRVLARTPRRVILTGTPAPNGLEDLWSQIYLLDMGERLEPYVTRYRERYFDYNPWRHELRPKAGAFERVKAKISDICVSMSAEDYLQLPELVTHDVPVRLDEGARRAYRELEKTMMLDLAKDGTEITAMNAAGRGDRRACAAVLRIPARAGGHNGCAGQGRAPGPGAEGRGRRGRLERGEGRRAGGASGELRLRTEPAAGRAARDLVHTDMEP